MPTKNQKVSKTIQDDSEEESYEFDKKKIDELFKNYDNGDVQDRNKFTRYLEDGENNDCLICKIIKFHQIFHSLNYYFRHSTNEK
jgi:hypothetical protein